MSDYPYLSLQHIAVDPELARTLPRRLAYYYLALPLACDDEQMTLVMAHPENRATIAVLEAALGTRVIPVQGSSEEIRAALNMIWSNEASSQATRILCWRAAPERVAVTAAMAEVFARARSAQTIYLDAHQNDLETALALAREERYSLTVIDAPSDETIAHALRRSSTPVLFLRGNSFSLRRILLALRGHSPDGPVLDWIIPVALAEQAAVTLLTVSPAAPEARLRSSAGAPYGLANLLSADSEPGQHIMSCTQRLAAAGIKGQLKLCQGSPEQAIASEASQGEYDLIALAAEAHGNFVQRVLSQIEALPANNQQSILVIKPIAD